MATAAQPQRQQAETQVIDFPLLDKVIARTLETADARKRIAPVSQGRSFDRIAAAVREEMIKTPILAKCSEESITAAVVKILRWNLEIGETAYLVPFKDRRNDRWVCTPVRSYLGDIQLLMDNQIARKVDARCVYKNEPFVYREGLNPVLEHTPLSPSERGPMIGAYAIVWLTYTNAKSAFLYLEEIDEVRARHSVQWKDGPCPPWWACKRAIKVATKLLPKSQRVREVLDRMDEDEPGVVASTQHAIANSRPAHITADGEDTAETETARQDTTDPQLPSPSCPKCGGNMWDNRASKTNPKAPDYKCRDRSCDGVYWPGQWPPKKEGDEAPTLGLDDKPAARGKNALAEP